MQCCTSNNGNQLNESHLNIFKLEVAQKERQLAFLAKGDISHIRQVFQAFALNIYGIAKVNEVRLCLVCWSSRLAKSRARTRLEESNCVELVKMVAVNWDNEIDNAVIAVDTDAGLDWFDGFPPRHV